MTIIFYIHSCILLMDKCFSLKLIKRMVIMTIKSLTYFLTSSITCFIIWRISHMLFLSNVITLPYGDYFALILIVMINLLLILYLTYFTDHIQKSEVITGTVIQLKKGVFNTFNRASKYGYSYKTYIKVKLKDKEVYLIGYFLEDDAIITDNVYSFKIRSSKILDYNLDQS